jgi:hypothetical protein
MRRFNSGYPNVNPLKIEPNTSYTSVTLPKSCLNDIEFLLFTKSEIFPAFYNILNVSVSEQSMPKSNRFSIEVTHLEQDLQPS